MSLASNDKSIMVVKPGCPLRGELGPGVPHALPGDKSLSHRAALFAALAQGDSQIENFLVSRVTEAMLGALTALEVPWELLGTSLSVGGVGLKGLPQSRREVYIHCGHSATTLRLLAGALAAWNLSATLDGSPGLRRRPMRRIVEPLQQMGVDIHDNDGCAPLTIKSTQHPLRAMDYTLPVASAQVKSCLTLAALAADGVTTLTEPGPSRDHTERLLRSMGIKVISETPHGTLETEQKTSGTHYVTRIFPPQEDSLVPLGFTLPGDISAAAFLIVAALITPGSIITLRGVGLNPTRTGLLEALLSMGAHLRITNRSEQCGEPVGDLTVRHSRLGGTRVDGDLVVRMIDEFPVFAVAAAFARGTTVVSEAVELRHKESDRISALCAELSSLGVGITETPDGFIVRGGKRPQAGTVFPHGDHRLAMSLAVAGLGAQGPVTIQDGEIIAESFPEFAPVIQSLGGNLIFGT